MVRCEHLLLVDGRDAKSSGGGLGTEGKATPACDAANGGTHAGQLLTVSRYRNFYPRRQSHYTWPRDKLLLHSIASLPSPYDIRAQERQPS